MIELIQHPNRTHWTWENERGTLSAGVAPMGERFVMQTTDETIGYGPSFIVNSLEEAALILSFLDDQSWVRPYVIHKSAPPYDAIFALKHVIGAIDIPDYQRRVLREIARQIEADTQQYLNKIQEQQQ